MTPSRSMRRAIRLRTGCSRRTVSPAAKESRHDEHCLRGGAAHTGAPGALARRQHVVPEGPITVSPTHHSRGIAPIVGPTCRSQISAADLLRDEQLERTGQPLRAARPISPREEALCSGGRRLKATDKARDQDGGYPDKQRTRTLGLAVQHKMLLLESGCRTFSRLIATGRIAITPQVTSVIAASGLSNYQESRGCDEKPPARPRLAFADWPGVVRRCATPGDRPPSIRDSDRPACGSGPGLPRHRRR